MTVTATLLYHDGSCESVEITVVSDPIVAKHTGRDFVTLPSRHVKHQTVLSGGKIANLRRVFELRAFTDYRGDLSGVVYVEVDIEIETLIDRMKRERAERF